jgi:DNA repair exonuclease SbcCD nuclease subunit
MGMKVLIFSDFHLHNWPYGSKLVDGMNSRLQAQADVFARLAKYTEENEVDHIVFCGDLFHTHGKINADVLKVAYEGFRNLIAAHCGSIDVLVGNHDTDRKDLSVHTLHWLNAFNDTTGNPPIRVIDTPVHNHKLEHYDGLPFSYLPYTEDAEVLKKFFAEAGEYCFMHQGMVDVPMASGFVVNEIMNYEMIPDHVKHVFTGHYHPHRFVGNKATVIGSIMQHTWADQGDDRGWLIFDTDSKFIKQIDSRAPKFQAVNMGSCASLGDLTADRSRFTNDYIRVTDFAEAGMETIRKEILAEGAASVEFVISKGSYKKTVVKAISGKGLSVPELVREYEKEHSISEDRRKVGRELMK